MKTLFKIILVLMFIAAVAYIAFAFAEGGFGKKEPAKLPLKGESEQLLFAHRGVVAGCPENSRESILQAKQKGFKAVEIDIRKSADPEFVLFHDETCSRLLGVNAPVSDLTVAQLKKFNLLMDKDTSSSKVLTLKEMLDEFKGDFIFYFDMKLKNMTDIDDLVILIETMDISKRVIVASTNPLVTMYIEYQYPVINTALEGFDAGKEWTWKLIPKNLKPDFLSGFASKVDDKQIQWLEKEELLNSRIVYGVDSTNYQAVRDLGIKNMILDFWTGLMVP
jgi:glycerophosphoryl diester phosphodiesterase